MSVVESIKRVAVNATGFGVPSAETALAMVRIVKPTQLRFRSDGYIPNNPSMPLLLYRKAVQFDASHDPAAALEQIFSANRWGEAWRNGIYSFVHYHSMIHEALGVASGTATIQLGGNKGKTIKVTAGDVLVVPAGVGHECLKASKTFLVVGAYPPVGKYDECRGSFQEYRRAVRTVERVAKPRSNPLYG